MPPRYTKNLLHGARGRGKEQGGGCFNEFFIQIEDRNAYTFRGKSRGVLEVGKGTRAVETHRTDVEKERQPGAAVFSMDVGKKRSSPPVKSPPGGKSAGGENSRKKT